jgi:hypothetical protein
MLLYMLDPTVMISCAHKLDQLFQKTNGSLLFVRMANKMHLAKINRNLMESKHKKTRLHMLK